MLDRPNPIRGQDLALAFGYLIQRGRRPLPGIGAIRDAIETITHVKPLESDVNRVSARLAAGGWPLARPGQAA